jgi:hypothetical protein
MKKTVLVFITFFVFSQMSFAQSTTSSSMVGFRRGVATVMLAGFGGAVLGLSTLSFYGEPQEHINNIWTGLALGALGGSAYVLSQAPRNNMAALDPFPESAKQKIAQQRPALFQYRFEF